MAADDDRVAAYDLKAGIHGLVVGDALGVVAFDDACDGVGQLHGALVDDLKVAYRVDDGCRGDEGDAVEHGLGELGVGNLDDAFCGAEFAALEIVADSHMAVKILDAEKSDSFEEHRRRDAVDYSAVTQGGYCEFFFIVGHYDEMIYGQTMRVVICAGRCLRHG